jgi:urocanate hydratase
MVSGRRAMAERGRFIALQGNADLIPAFFRGRNPDLTDQTSAHDLLNGYVPHAAYRAVGSEWESNPRGVPEACPSLSVGADLMKAGAVTFDYGNNIRQAAREGGCRRLNPGFVASPAVLRGERTFPTVIPPGSQRHQRADRPCWSFSRRCSAGALIPMAQKGPLPGLPARICGLGWRRRARFGLILE